MGWFNRVMILTVLLGTVLSQEGNIRYVRADELRDYLGRCFDAERCSLRQLGESWTVDPTCERATCVSASNGTLLERRVRCSQLPAIMNEDCYIIRVEGMTFPHCCPQLFCKGKLIRTGQ